MSVLQAFGDGVFGSAIQVVLGAGSVILVLMLVALGGYAYKQLRGDGVEWPDEDPEHDEGVKSGDADDEWDYY
jgi:hypothetical protein